MKLGLEPSRKKSVADREIEKLTRGRAAVDSSATNVTSHAFGHLVQKCCLFLAGTFGHELHSPVRQVTYKTRYGKSPRDAGSRIPKTDSLNMPRVENLAALGNGGSHVELLARWDQWPQSHQNPLV